MDKKKADDLLKTLVSAYVWVASADEGVRVVELRKYEHVIVQSQFATQFNTEDIRHYFKDMVRLFADNYEAAVQLTKSRLSAVAGQDQISQEVIRLCRAALISDGVVNESEELVLKVIAETLGVSQSI